MADIYDVNAAIQKPNIVNALRQGQQYGMQLKQQQQQIADQNALRDLAPKIIAGDQNAFAQGAAISPEQAGQYQQAGDGQLRRLKGAIDYFDKGLQSGDDRLIQARYREIAPFLSSLTGQPAPEAYTPDMLPAFEQVKTKIALARGGAKSELPSEIQTLQMLQDNPDLLAINDRFRGTKSFREVINADGTKSFVALDNRAGTGANTPITGLPTTGPAPQPAANGATYTPTGTDESAQIESEIGRPLTDQERMQIANGTFSLTAPVAAPQPAAAPISGYGQTDAQRAAAAAQEAIAVARGKAGVELSTAPMIAGATEGAKLDANLSRADQVAAADANRQRQIDTAKSETERDSKRIELDTTYNLYKVARDELASALKGARTGPIAGSVTALLPEDQNAESAVAAMAPVLKQLFRAAGEGTFTKDDQAILMAMLPTRKTLPEARDEAFRRIDAIVEAKLQGGGGTADTGGYRVGQVIEAGGKRYRVTGGDPADPDVEEIQ